ncbi:DUF802 domain-containing protein [Alloalcanivorax gelatiniphagus]|uniref:DUF802 domain-containing protein n=1 Tax=Alloalcanivorax gelatiniphagus TaxID=1194167 RepID=A0ABY2XHD0_9GAMM|nr:DUF802 domain-containing protein [Alloalcanivorax gelatiniphagus]TMW11078.1 DUF802 domain-containing protein [Alloalcanivorax gelatiniphagus]
MTRFLFALAFFLGAAAVLRVGLGFVAGPPVALLATALIALVYGFGFLELLRFRRATDQLRDTLRSTPCDEQSLGGWLASLPAELRGPVRRRVEGEPAALPGPMLTPYLSGLLIMLGLLGTFVGMTVTLQGAVAALDGGANLEAIQSALAAPIAGLSLAFGTSIAGVAASAMLGLAATFCRRERLLVGRDLDGRINRELRPFSLKQQQRDTFQALREQAGAFPAVVDQLRALSERLDQMGERLAGTLTDNQRDFHQRIGDEYQALSRTVGDSLQRHLAEGARQTAESMRPVMEDAMTRLHQQTERTHAHLGAITEQQLAGLAERFRATTDDTAEQWQRGLAEAREAQDRQLAQLAERFEQVTARAGETWQQGLAEQNRQQGEHGERLTRALEATAERVREDHEALIAHGRDQQEQLTERYQRQLAATAEQFATSTDQAARHWREALQEQQRQGATLITDLGAALEAHDQRFQSTAEQLLAGHSDGLESQRQHLDTLVGELNNGLQRQQEAFRQASGELLDGQRQGLDTLLARTGEDLAALRDQESARGEAAVQRLADLEATAARHLTELGTALEAPLARLIETASETPKAATEVITRLREEMARSGERDNELLEERHRLMHELDALLGAQRQAAEAQRQAVETLIKDAGGALREVSDTFGAQVERQSTQLDSLAGDLTEGARDVASLSDAFGGAVLRFGESNDKLLDTLQRIEAALEQSASRHDEQLAYYVEQAREVIDLSLAAQKDVAETSGQPHADADGAGAR